MAGHGSMWILYIGFKFLLDSTKVAQGQSMAYMIVGCYLDVVSQRDLNGYNTWPASTTQLSCYNTCKQRNFPYAGVQYGGQCYCGNTYGRYGTSNDCNMLCTGSSSQNCGGIALKYTNVMNSKKLFSNSYIVSKTVPVIVDKVACSSVICGMYCRQNACLGFNIRKSSNNRSSCLCELITTNYFPWNQYSLKSENGASFWRVLDYI